MYHEPSVIAAIEDGAGKQVTIDSESNASSLRKCHPQEQSPLFSCPPELRDIIWSHSHENLDDSLEFAENPDLSGGRPRFHTALLLTCRRIWLEANAISFPNTVHRTWHKGGGSSDKHLIEDLTALNRSRLEALHVVLEGCWISFSKDYSRENLPLWPAKLIVTVLSWPWEMMHGTRELGTYMHIYIADLLLDDSIRNTQEVEFHLEERVENLPPGVGRRQPGIDRLHYVQRRNLNTRGNEDLNDVVKYWKLEPVESEPCRYWTRRIPNDRIVRPEDPRTVNYLTYKFTWRRIAAFPDGYRSTADIRHTSRGDGPAKPVATPVTYSPDQVQSTQRWERRWDTQQSLLRFAP